MPRWATRPRSWRCPAPSTQADGLRRARFSEAIADVAFHPLAIPFYSNITGRQIHPDADLRQYLIQHLVSPVHFHEEVSDMVADGVDMFIELGPNKVLTSLIKRGFKQVSACNIEKPSAVEKLRETL
ncbi:MAG: ACP S-malonyltransferase [Anaerotruncus massiliensis (ex Togo et al. 2019)]